MQVFAANRLRGVVVYASSSLRPGGGVVCMSPTIDSRHRLGIHTLAVPRHFQRVEGNALLVAYSESRKW